TVGQQFFRAERPIKGLGEIQLDAIAGAEDDRFAAEAHGHGVEGAVQGVAVEGEPFTHRDRRVLVTTADSEEDHGTPFCPTGCDRVRQPSSRTNVTMVHSAICRPRRWAPKRRYSRAANASQRTNALRTRGSVQLLSCGTNISTTPITIPSVN